MKAGWKNELTRRFGNDLQVLEQRLGSEIETAEELTRIISDKLQKASFKVRLEDGRDFKLRRFKSAGDWSSFVALAPLLENLSFSRLIYAHGIASIEQWITGTSLADTNITNQQLSWAGGLLGQLHNIRSRPVAEQTSPPGGQRYLDSINAHLSVLVEHAALDPVFAQNLYELAHQALPAHLEVGLIHGDFCAENMVVTASGKIVVIDNESLRVGALDYDIARCWSRWPMTDSQRAAFAEGYRRHRGLDRFNQHRDFWAIKALSQTVYVRLEYNKPYQSALDALKQIGFDSGGDHWLNP